MRCNLPGTSPYRAHAEGPLSLVTLLLPVQAGSPANIEVQKLEVGVYAVIRTDPPGIMFEANSAFIIGAEDVVVIDGGSNPTSAKEVLAAIRRVTESPCAC